MNVEQNQKMFPISFLSPPCDQHTLWLALGHLKSGLKFTPGGQPFPWVLPLWGVILRGSKESNHSCSESEEMYES